MFLNLLIISIILVALVMLALGVKMWFDPDAEFTANSCAHEDGGLNRNGACSKCQLKEIAKRPEKPDKNV
jgi:hypothetical protein